MQYLPIWDSPVRQSVAATHRLHRVAAIQALVLPPQEIYYKNLTPDLYQSRLVQETPAARRLIKELGGVQLDNGDYVFRYVIPSLPETLEATQLISLTGFLSNLLNLCKRSYQQTILTSAQLIPDRTGRLRVGSELYSHSNTVFKNCFRGQDKRFPHQRVTGISLRKFGVQSTVTKSNFLTCVRSLERDVQSKEADDDDVWARCHSVWIEWNNMIHNEVWSTQELKEIARVQFIPALRSMHATTYRDTYMKSIVAPNTISTLNDVISPEYIPIAWTQRISACTTPASFLNQIGFAPSVLDVVNHLVSLACVFASECTIQERAFFDDLIATYNFLNQPSNIPEASLYLQEARSDKALWLNTDFSLRGVENILHGNMNPETTVDSLLWLPASSILHGVPYDLPTYGLYSAKSSLEPYRNILRVCGSHVVESIKANIKIEGVENHGNKMLGRIRTMLGSSDSMCDLKIIVGQQEHQAHRLLLGAVSPYFHRLCCGDWSEKSTGILNLDENSYGTSDSVRSVIEWVYNGFLTLDDGNLENLDVIQNRLEHYLDVLELSHVWDMPELGSHIESRILTYAQEFIRVENVSGVSDIAARYNASQLAEYCLDFIAKNKMVVELVENSEA